MAPEQGMQLASNAPNAPQKPQPQGGMPSPGASVGGNRPPLNYGQRPGGDVTIPQDQGFANPGQDRGGSVMGRAAREALARKQGGG